jgi:hypothetical protein
MYIQICYNLFIVVNGTTIYSNDWTKKKGKMKGCCWYFKLLWVQTWYRKTRLSTVIFAMFISFSHHHLDKFWNNNIEKILIITSLVLVLYSCKIFFPKLLFGFRYFFSPLILVQCYWRIWLTEIHTNSLNQDGM